MGHREAHRDAVVVGANVAGLTTAYALAALGFRTTLVEKASGVGGTDRSFTTPGGRRFDFGLHVLDEMRSEVTTRLFLHAVRGEVVRRPRRRGIVLRNHTIPYNALPRDWPAELRALLPGDDLRDELGTAPTTRANLARYYGEEFVRLIFDETLRSYPSETRHLEFGVDESALLTNIYPWFFPRAERAAADDDPSRRYHDRKREQRDETFYYPKEGGFGAFARGLADRLIELGGEVIDGADDLDLDVDRERHVVRSVVAGGRRLTADRVLWCAPPAILARVLGVEPHPPKPDRFVLGSFVFERPLTCEFHELLYGDSGHPINRSTFPGYIDRRDTDLFQVEFSFPKAGDAYPADDVAYWRETWLSSLHRLGIARPDNRLLEFDFKSTVIVYNCYGIEGRRMPDVRFDLHPESNVLPVLPSVRNININTRVPQFLRFVLDEVCGPPRRAVTEPVEVR